jgi:very-short-patch-repair endonuclease
MTVDIQFILMQTHKLWISEYRFNPKRKYKFDFANIENKIALEIEGGTWNNGRHVRGEGYAKDCWKYNEAAILGWKVLRFTSDMIRLTPALVLDQIEEAMAIK